MDESSHHTPTTHQPGSCDGTDLVDTVFILVRNLSLSTVREAITGEVIVDALESWVTGVGAASSGTVPPLRPSPTARGLSSALYPYNARLSAICSPDSITLFCLSA